MSTQLTFHGGNINWAANKFCIPRADWIDLSTGINPNAYPFSPLNKQVFTQLPYLNDEFIRSAENYYNHPVIPVAGSQEAIDALPQILPKQKVLLPDIGYKAYEKILRQHGYAISYYPAIERQSMIAHLNRQLLENPHQHLVIINPNNPTGLILSQSDIKKLRALMSEQSYLIVDEAFMDMTPQASLLHSVLPENCIILRSFGKFFGLAGLRLGFIATHEKLGNKFREILNPWRINGCAQQVAQEAFNDQAWQAINRQWITAAAQEQLSYLAPLMAQYQVEKLDNQTLFHSFLMHSEDADNLFLSFAHHGILTRQIDVSIKQKILRLGLIDTRNKVILARFISTIRILKSGKILKNPSTAA